MRALAIGSALLLALPSLSAAQPRPRPRPLEADRTAAASPPPLTACQSRLALSGLRFRAEKPPPATDAACRVEDPVRLEALSLPAAAGGGELLFPDRPIVACSLAEVWTAFNLDALVPLARGHLGVTPKAIGTGPGFACRGRNRVPGARISAHGRGLAVDVAWLQLDGRPPETVAAPGPDAARLFNALRRAGCGWFTTVLGPGSDAAHADHLHFDREPRGRDGESRFCQ